MRALSDNSRWRVAVLAGGDSAERDVSLRSGAAVAAALSQAGHRATRIDPADSTPAQVDWSRYDVAFIALHGGSGEDGRTQQELEDLRVPYTGSSPAACRLAMSKSASKDRFREAGVPTPPFVPLAPSDSCGVVAARAARLGYPLVVKPDSQGSSLGVSIVDAADQLPRAIAEGAEYDGALLAEALVVGREFTVAVLGDRPLPLLEIVTPQRLFSYGAKYQDAATDYRFDFALPPAQRAEIVQAAIGATQALGTWGLARVDLMLGVDGRAWVLEVNTSPGMTARSLAPLAAARAGLDMSRLCDRLVQECLVGARNA